MRGEAYFLRAYWHFYLLTRFGDIPIMDDFWDGNATVAGLQIPATKRSDVARFILSDLKAAIGELPETRASLFSLNIKDCVLTRRRLLFSLCG